MIFFASILVAGLASTSWASPAAPAAITGAPSTQTTPDDCAVLATAFPTLFNSSVNCCTVGSNACNNGRLTNMSVTNNNLNGPAPDLSKLTNLINLDLSGNQFIGAVPDLSKLTNLINLDLSNNYFYGPAPDLSKLTNLQSINLSNNGFNESLADLSKLTNIINLDLSYNFLIGPIPDIFGSMTKLTQADLSGNQFTGSLPPSLLNRPNLQDLYLNNNTMLIGQFGDAQSTNLPAIKSINFQDTQLILNDPLETKLGLPSFYPTMASGLNAPPAVPQGNSSDPWVTWLDPAGNWHTQQVNDPSALLNGNYVVSAIGGVNICSGNWAFLYNVPTPANYPSCQGIFGVYNTGFDNSYGTPGYSNLQYGTCPQSVYHWGVGGNQWGTETYSNCWTGYYNWGTTNTGDGGISVFPNGMRVGYCCFN